MGRQKKRWEDTIKVCTGTDFASSSRAAETELDENGVADSAAVPYRPYKAMG